MVRYPSFLPLISPLPRTRRPIMTSKKTGVSRRDLMKTTGQVAAVGALAGVALPQVHADGSETIKIALVGCGGRGTGAAANALRTTQGPTQLVAMADVFPGRLTSSFNDL